MHNTPYARITTNLLVLTAAFAATCILGGCSKQTVVAPLEEPTVESPAPETPAAVEDVTELKVEDLSEGTGAEAVEGSVVNVHYTGWLTDGTKFDSSLDSGRPFSFTIGAGRVIQGWEVGVAGMRVGGTRRLTIPPSMGYGDAGAGGVIPPGATLVFEIELLDVQ
jgi:FKBP-type peptidyl-prolyl cis-trans isomerase